MSPITGNQVTALSGLGAELAAFPDLTKKKKFDDGLESSGHAIERAQLQGLTQIDQNGIVEQRPTLATITDPVTVHKTIDGLVRSQLLLASNRWAIDLYARRVRGNVPFVYLEKVPNQATWVCRMPDGITRERAGASPNKADDLLNKIVNALEADPMRPAPISHLDSEAAEQATALASELLRSVFGESGINWEQKHRWALDVGLTCGSGFLHYDMDATGGGYQPYQVLAHPQATDPENPKDGPPLAPGQPPMPTPDPILRYVSSDGPDGQFVEDAAQAAKVWIPKFTCDRIRREQVRMFPPDADVESARAVALILWCTLEQGIAKWPETVGKMSQTDLQGLAAWRPVVGQSRVVPYALINTTDGQSGPNMDDVGTMSPLLQRRMFYYRLYIKSQPEYEKGWVCDSSGYKGGMTLGTDVLEYQVQLPTQGTTTRCRDIPLEQVRPTQDVDGGDPMGWAVLHRVAGSSEVEQFTYSAYQDAINLRLNPHVLIRSTVAVDADDWSDRTKPIILNPSDPEPNYEQFPAMPDVLGMIDNLDRKMDSAIGLGETAQGLETNTSISGVAKQITVQQAARDLSGMLQQLNAAKTRGCRIILQIAQAKCTVPQLMQYTGEDGSVQTQWWTGENLAGVDDIGIEPGTGTTMTPEGKAQLAQYAQNLNWLSPQDAAKVGLSGIQRDLGLPPDAQTEAIERECGLWLKGPPEGWLETWQAAQPIIQANTAAQSQFQQAATAFGIYQKNAALSAGGPPPSKIGPEGQNAAAMLAYQMAVQALQEGQQQAFLKDQQAMMSYQQTALVAQQQGQPVPPAPVPSWPPQPPTPPQLQPVPPVFTPFVPRPNDTEPSVAAKLMARLSLLQFSPQYTRYPQPWRSLVDDRYTSARQATAMIPAQHPASPMQQPSQGTAPSGGITPGVTHGASR